MMKDGLDDGDHIQHEEDYQLNEQNSCLHKHGFLSLN